jgi:Fe-S cluster assembly iron-binding protein IscA
MVTVTVEAAAKLREQLEAGEGSEDVSFRLVSSPSESGRLHLTLDSEKEGDQVFENEGVKVLLLAPDVNELLDGRVIGYEKSAQGEGFTIKKPERG